MEIGFLEFDPFSLGKRDWVSIASDLKDGDEDVIDPSHETFLGWDGKDFIAFVTFLLEDVAVGV
jgi:hypothetical protein